MAEVLVRYFASARAASGVTAEKYVAIRVQDAVRQVSERHGARMAAILGVSSLLLDGVHVGDLAALLPQTAELDILPPFAGG